MTYGEKVFADRSRDPQRYNHVTHVAHYLEFIPSNFQFFMLQYQRRISRKGRLKSFHNLLWKEMSLPHE